MKKQVCSSLLALSMTASILSPAALAAEQVTVSDDNQNAIAVVSENDAAGNNDAVADQTNSEQNESEEVTVNTEDQSADSDKESEEDAETPNAEADFTTKAVDGGVEITDYSGSATEVVIPKTIGEASVVSIGSSSFYNKKAITSVTLPSGLKSIGNSAFENCTSLKSIILPDNISSIGQAAFKDCTSLKSVTLPNSLTELNGGLFHGCTSLEEVTIPTSVSSENTYAAFNSDCTSLKTVYYCGTFANWQTLKPRTNLPEGVTVICLGDYEFAINKEAGEVYISGYNDAEKAITLPAKYKGYPVTNITDKAFNHKNITSVTIPRGIKSIDGFAFMNCLSLTSITLPSSLKTIGSDAFASCTSLQKIVIPNGVTVIPSEAFLGCTSLTEITIPRSVTRIAQNAFKNVSLTTINYGGTEDEWKKIDIYNTDGGNDTLVKQTPSNTAVQFGDFIYKQNKGAYTVVGYTGDATEVEIPEDAGDLYVTAIDDRAFANNKKITSVMIPNRIRTIGDSVFDGCDALETVTYDGAKTDWNSLNKGENDKLDDVALIYLGDFSYANYTDSDGTYHTYITEYKGNDAKITIPAKYKGEEIVGITNNGFFGNRTITSVTMPDSIKSIGSGTFDYCSNLTKVKWSSGLETIGFRAFEETGLTEVTLPEGVTTIGGQAFLNAKVASVTLPESITQVESEAFKGCTALESVTFKKDTVTKNDDATEGDETIKTPGTMIGSSAFSGCTKLSKVTLPADAEWIASGLFNECSSLKKVTIPDTVTDIGGGAFQSSGIEQINIPGGVTEIGSWAFNTCNSLTTVYYGSTKTAWEALQNHIGANNEPLLKVSNMYYTSGDYTYQVNEEGEVSITKYNGKNTKTAIPSELDGCKVTSIDAEAFKDCDTLKTVAIPSSVTSIGEDAFNGCTDLETINYGGTKTDWDNLKYNIGANNEPLLKVSNMYYTSGDYTYQVNEEGEVSITKYNGKNTKTAIPSELDGCKVTSIDAEAFKDCTALEEITIPTSITSIGKDAFNNCKKLKEVTIPSSVKTLGEAAFAFCGLQTVTIEEGLTTIPVSAFSYCEDLNTITIPKSVTSIGQAAFATVAYHFSGYEDAVLSTVNYGGTKAEWETLQNDIGLHNEPLTKATTINYHSGDYTYRVNAEGEVSIVGYNGKDEKVEIPSELDDCKVTSIDAEAFKDCDTLKDITIPKSITSIGEKAFDGCTGLEKAYYNGYEENISIADGNEPLTKVLTYKSKIICKGSEQVKISKGTHEMRIHGQSYGKYTFTWNEEQAGWLVQNADEQYLSFADGELVLSDEPFVWHYDAKLYTTTEEKVQHKFWWWSYTTTKTVYWYLTGDGENLTISNSSEEADLALYDAVEATEHSFTEWSYVGDKTHRRVCTVCGEKETAECTYGEDGYCTECGQFNPDLASVSVTAKVTKHTTRSGWWWWCRPTTTWTANITAAGEGVDVETVEYSLDGEAYETGTCFTSKEEITTFYIRVTDSNDNVTNWIYEDGEVTQVTDQDSEQTPDQGSDSDFRGGE